MNETIIEKCKGMLLGTASGDILGAGVEGQTREQIVVAHGEVRDFLSTTRGFGCYTDDTEMTLALSQSMVDCNGMDAAHCSQMYADYYNPSRGYGGGAHTVLKALKDGADFKDTGYISFKEGSFGNGGAMRIAPVGVVCRGASDGTLKKAVFDAVRCTHVHPEGVDGAVVQAKAAALMTGFKNAAQFAPLPFLDALANISTTSIMRENIAYLRDTLKKDIPDITAVRNLGNGIRASEAVSCALLAVVRYYRTPEEAVIKSVNFGGDTDTIGAMTGALMGAMHGTGWIPHRWLDNIENKQYGKDYMIQLADQLASV
ncbi:MAG: hypothetical protein GY940_32515 [bacterium]|nr:hypothetical protein [bacterium]